MLREQPAPSVNRVSAQGAARGASAQGAARAESGKGPVLREPAPTMSSVVVGGCGPGVPLRDTHAALVPVRNDPVLRGLPDWWLLPIRVVSRSGIPALRVASRGIIRF